MDLMVQNVILATDTECLAYCHAICALHHAPVFAYDLLCTWATIARCGNVVRAIHSMQLVVCEN